MSVICSWFERIPLKKGDSLKKCTYFSSVFDSFWQFLTVFPPFYVNSLPSLFTQSLFFKIATVSKSLLSFFTKEQLWAICSCCSWQKSDGSDSLKELMSDFPTLDDMYGGEPYVLNINDTSSPPYMFQYCFSSGEDGENFFL